MRCMHCINVMTGGAGPGQGPRRDRPGGRQAHPEDRRPDGHRGRSLHEARIGRGLREAGRHWARTSSTSSPRTRWSTSAPAR
ncbi:MAG: hypothetical protein MZW92_78935 [Comamonadaceae bacterium]|nr:hypothetical protein [Comamonadaceae bacterium]